MIAIDTSSMIGFLSGASSADAEAVAAALRNGLAVFPPVVLAELLSDPAVPEAVATLLTEVPMLALTEGYWQRAGLLRAKVLASGRRARLADVLITQSCVDHDVPLVTADGDFRHFVGHARLRLLP